MSLMLGKSIKTELTAATSSMRETMRETMHEARENVEPYARAVIGLLAIIAGSLVLIALGIWGGSGR